MIVHAHWIQKFGQRLELRTTKPSPGLRPSQDVFGGDLLGHVQQVCLLGKFLPEWTAALWTSPLTFETQKNLPSAVAAMSQVETWYRERNPDVTLRVYGDAPQILDP